MVATVLITALLSLQVGQTGYDQKSIPGTMCLPRNLVWTDWSILPGGFTNYKGLRNISGGPKFATCPVIRDKLDANLYDFVVKGNNPSGGTFACTLYSCTAVTGQCSSVPVPNTTKQTNAVHVTLYWQNANAEIPGFRDTYVVECEVPNGATLMAVAWTEQGVTD